MKSLQRLPKAEENALIEMACANGLTRNELKCVMTRQQAQGRGRFSTRGKGVLDGQEYGISYSLMLCEFCGNLEPSSICPGKVLKIKERLLNA